MKNLLNGWTKGVVCALGLILSGCDQPPNERTSDTLLPDTLLYVWAYDEDYQSPSFLIVVDADHDSPTYGTILDTVLSEGAGMDAHHSNHFLPSSGRLFANDFMGGRTHIFDTTANPLEPVYKGWFKNLGDYTYPHSFVELAGGNVLATFQTKGEGNEVTGGLVELSPEAEMVRAVDAENPALPMLRPYSLEVLPEIDRVVTTSADMMEKVVDHRLQIWRLSDLKLITTLELPQPDREEARNDPMEARVLADGKTLYINTYMCGLYRLTGVETQTPEVTFVKDFGNLGCAIPQVIGKYYLLALGQNNAISVLDVSDPANPVEVSRLGFSADFEPHWIAADPAGRRIALTGYGDALKTRIMMLDFNPETGTLSVDESFGEGDEKGPGVMVNIQTWPHGDTGPAIVHAAVFRVSSRR